MLVEGIQNVKNGIPVYYKGKGLDLKMGAPCINIFEYPLGHRLNLTNLLLIPNSSFSSDEKKLTSYLPEEFEPDELDDS